MPRKKNNEIRINFQNSTIPGFLRVGSKVSAKFKGAFCSASVEGVVQKNIICQLYFHQTSLGNQTVNHNSIVEGKLEVGEVVNAKHPSNPDALRATILMLTDKSKYGVVFSDGDRATVKRTQISVPREPNNDNSDVSVLSASVSATHSVPVGSSATTDIGAQAGEVHIKEEAASPPRVDEPEEMIGDVDNEPEEMMQIDDKEIKVSDDSQDIEPEVEPIKVPPCSSERSSRVNQLLLRQGELQDQLSKIRRREKDKRRSRLMPRMKKELREIQKKDIQEELKEIQEELKEIRLAYRKEKALDDIIEKSENRTLTNTDYGKYMYAAVNPQTMPIPDVTQPCLTLGRFDFIPKLGHIVDSRKRVTLVTKAMYKASRAHYKTNKKKRKIEAREQRKKDPESNDGDTTDSIKKKKRKKRTKEEKQRHRERKEKKMRKKATEAAAEAAAEAALEADIAAATARYDADIAAAAARYDAAAKLYVKDDPRFTSYLSAIGIKEEVEMEGVEINKKVEIAEDVEIKEKVDVKEEVEVEHDVYAFEDI